MFCDKSQNYPWESDPWLLTMISKPSSKVVKALWGTSMAKYTDMEIDTDTETNASKDKRIDKDTGFGIGKTETLTIDTDTDNDKECAQLRC